MFHASNAYWLETVQVASRRLKTNTVSDTAFRGFGGPQGMIAIERAIDAIARERGLDPLDVRIANFYRPGGDITPYTQVVDDLETLPTMIRELEASSDYRARRREIAEFNAKSPILKRGIALTPVMFGISFTLIHLNQAGALVHVYTDGSIQLNHGGTEMGQGLHTKVAQVVAEEFGVPLNFVRITATNTAKVPNASPTAASSGADINGMAAMIAARQIRDRMAAVAAETWGLPAEKIEFREGRVFGGNASMSFAELAKHCRLNRVQLSAAGYYKTPEIHWDRAAAKGKPFFYYAFGAACAEVAIDTLTGELKVLGADILHDVGSSLNPALDLGQVEGAFVQGMGWVTTEELVHDEQGTPDDPRAGDLQDPGRLRRPRAFRHQAALARQLDRQHLSLQGGRRAAVHAGDLGLFGDSRRGACGQARRSAEAGSRRARRRRYFNAIRSLGD